MKFDHSSAQFNSYSAGPGRSLQNREEKDVISLFVDRIPAPITKVCVCLLVTGSRLMCSG